MEESETLLTAANLGQQTEEFFRGEFGQYMLERVQERIDNGLDKLVDLPPFRKLQTLQLQAEVKTLKHFQDLITQCILEGAQSAHILEGSPE